MLQQHRNLQQGFSLTEMAIVLVIVSLLLGGLMPMLVQGNLQGYKETGRAMSDIKEALIGYAMVNGHLPCPAPADLSTNGAEGPRAAGACSHATNSRYGLLPWADLGIDRLDHWGRHFHYNVSPTFSDSTTKFTLTSTGDLTIQTRDSGGALVTLASTVPAVIVSHGQNGYWGISDTGTTITDSSSTNTDEDTNGAGSTTYVSRSVTGPNDNVTGGTYDDIVVWISPSVLFNRMVTAGKLP